MLWIYLLSGFSSNEIVIGAGATGSGANTCTIAASTLNLYGGATTTSLSLNGVSSGYTGSDTVLTQISLGGNCGPYIKAIQNPGYVDNTSFNIYNNAGVNTSVQALRFQVQGCAAGGNVIVYSQLIAQSGLNLTGTFTNNSDFRLKDNIQPISGSSLDKLLQLKPCTFTYKNDCYKVVSGFIAQEVQPIFPSSVHVSSNPHTLYTGETVEDVLSLSTLDFVPHLVKSTQELYVLVQYQKQTIDELLARIVVLEQKN